MLLVIAGLLEVGWATGLKYSHGFTRLWPSVWTAMAIVVSMVLLSVAMRSLPAGTAYAVWTGIGTVGTVILGIVLLGEPATLASRDLHRPRPARDHRTQGALARMSRQLGPHVHDLRHTFASHVMKRGGKVAERWEILGHAASDRSGRWKQSGAAPC